MLLKSPNILSNSTMTAEAALRPRKVLITHRCRLGFKPLETIWTIQEAQSRRFEVGPFWTNQEAPT